MSGPTGDTATPPPGDRPRIEVVRGGPLDERQTAALAVAVAAAAAAGVDAGPIRPDHAWARAARIEGIGRPRVDRPSDLDQAG